jgi:RNA polymerase sigma-70 factor (ECF subfamily)
MGLDPSEEQLLVAGCKKNESWAQKKLYELYAPAMLGLCTRYANNKEKAKDILHEGFITVFAKINTFSGGGSLVGWMRRVFVTKALEILRSEHIGPYANISDCEDEIEAMSISAIERLSADDILECISELPKGYRLVFNMYAIEGYSHAEIANMLNIKEGTSRSQFAHARLLLQNKIQELYIHVNAKEKYE